MGFICSVVLEFGKFGILVLASAFAGDDVGFIVLGFFVLPILVVLVILATSSGCLDLL